jgi:4-carboxymuconolactone decarboxylase
MARLPLFDPTNMSAEQARVYNEIINGRRGQLVGPLRAVLHRPDLADHWQRFGEALRFGTSLPQKLVELAILVTARRWNSQVEWHIHSQEALNAGLSDNVILAIKQGQAPDFADADEASTYEFARQLQTTGNVDDALYARLHAVLGTVGIVELSSVIGYYTLVSMTLNVHDITLPNEKDELPVADRDRLSDLPRAHPFAPFLKSEK